MPGLNVKITPSVEFSPAVEALLKSRKAAIKAHKIKLQEAISKAILHVQELVALELEEWRDTYFPSSVEAGAGKWGPPGYAGGRLSSERQTTISFLQNKPYGLTLSSNTEYASYVNQMVGVDWTNPMTVVNFFTYWATFAMREYAELLKDDLIKIDPGVTVTITYTGVTET